MFTLKYNEFQKKYLTNVFSKSDITIENYARYIEFMQKYKINNISQESKQWAYSFFI